MRATTVASNFPTGRDFIELAYLLDTSVAILIRDDNSEAKVALAQLGEVPSISAVSLVELEGGVHANPPMFAQRRVRLDALLETMEVIDFTTSMAKTYGAIVGSVGYGRRKIIDRMIAATAFELDLTVVTLNGEDFAEIEGLKLLVWDA